MGSTSRVGLTLGVIVALCAAFSVLFHHGSVASAMGSALPAMPGTSAGSDHSATVHRGGASADMAHGIAGSGSPVQHCGAASLDTVKLPLPRQCHRVGALLPLDEASGAVRVPTAERGPPDLSVLSRLRI